jgi:hypothetical protein
MTAAFRAIDYEKNMSGGIFHFPAQMAKLQNNARADNGFHGNEGGYAGKEKSRVRGLFLRAKRWISRVFQIARRG